MSSSLTEAGPRCLIMILPTFGGVICARTAGRPAKTRTSPHKRSRNFIVARSIWHVFVAYFGCAFKPRIGLQKSQTHFARRTIALFGNQQIHRQRLFIGPAATGVVIVTLSGPVKQTNQVGILLNAA